MSNQLTLLTWNCNGAFRNKFHLLKSYNADIVVIQECEDPKLSNHEEYNLWASNYYWKGDSKNKGLGIFFKRKFNSITINNWTTEYEGSRVKYFLSLNLNNQFDLVALWLHKNNSPTFGYIGQLWKYLQLNKSQMGNSILIGDFNSNKKWDVWDRWWNHSDVLNNLQELGINSLYHKHFNENQGEETQPTFYMHRNLHKPYHIDYILVPDHIYNEIVNIKVGDSRKWLQYSDHVPLITTIDVINCIA